MDKTGQDEEEINLDDEEEDDNNVDDDEQVDLMKDIEDTLEYIAFVWVPWRADFEMPNFTLKLFFFYKLICINIDITIDIHAK